MAAFTTVAARQLAQLTGMAVDIVQESPWQDAWRPPDCQCFALCETGELMKLFSHLPILVYNDSSPFNGYPYGCWFWPLPGSGIFINIGKSLRAQGTGHAV